MKAKTSKVYTLAQVGKLLGVGQSTVYNYISVGLIQVLPRAPGKKEGRMVTEAEFQRLKRDGVTPTGIKAKLAKRSAAAAAAKKRVKRKATAAVSKKLVKRNAAATTRTAAKKQAKRRSPGKTASRAKK